MVERIAHGIEQAGINLLILLYLANNSTHVILLLLNYTNASEFYAMGIPIENINPSPHEYSGSGQAYISPLKGGEIYSLPKISNFDYFIYYLPKIRRRFTC
jgi:hypothetical protein